MLLYGNTLKIAMHKHYKHNNNAMLQYGMEDPEAIVLIPVQPSKGQSLK